MTRKDDGSAAVEFVLVSILVVTLLLALIQLGLALHIRNTLIADAAEGARYAAAQDRDADAGAEYTVRLIESTLPGDFEGEVTAGYENIYGVPTVVVEIRTDLPVFGWIGPADALVVQGHAMEES